MSPLMLGGPVDRPGTVYTPRFTTKLYCLHTRMVLNYWHLGTLKNFPYSFKSNKSRFSVFVFESIPTKQILISLPPTSGTSLEGLIKKLT